MNPTGLVTLGRRNLARLAVVYVLFAGIALAVPALIAWHHHDSPHLRDESPHPNHETNRR